MTRRIVMLVALLLAVLLPPAAGRAGAASVGAGRQVQEPHGARRVVSLNLCTDQLAVRLAAPGQLLSVSNWALKPASSMVVNEVRGLVINHGQAEEILPLKPDLVLVGDFTNRATVGLLRRLGRDVQEFGTPQDFDGIVAQVRRMAGLLGREAEGERMVAAFRGKLARVSRALSGDPHRPLAALYLPSGDSAGAGTMIDLVLHAAGYRNLAAGLGLVGRSRLPLERLLLGRPQVLVYSSLGERAPSIAEERLHHPALRRFARGREVIDIAPRAWVCPGPMLADTVLELWRRRPPGRG